VGQNEETQTELKASSNWMEKAKVRVGDNVIKFIIIILFSKQVI